MNTPEENLDGLRKLLSLKQHEQPPPGYFEDLSGKIIARIEAGEAQPAWWQGLLPGWINHPVLVGAYGILAATLVLAGIQLSGRHASQPASPPAGGPAGMIVVDTDASQPSGAELPTSIPTLADTTDTNRTSTSSPADLFNTPSMREGGTVPVQFQTEE